MLVNIGDYRQEIDYVTMMGHLNPLWEYGNSVRRKKGLHPSKICTWLVSKTTCEFIVSLENQLSDNATKLEIIGCGRCGYTIKGGELTVLKTKRGKGGGTYAHLYILLNAMIYLLGEEIKIKVFDAISDLHNVLNQLGNFEIPEDILDQVKEPLYVYAIREVGTGNVKLGISRNPENRVSELQTGNSNQLELVGCKQVKSFRDERLLHRKMNKYHIHGEWFTKQAIRGIK